MGNIFSCCGGARFKKEEIKNKKQFLKAILDCLTKSQDQLGNYEKKSEENKETPQNLSFEQYQYYISLNNSLIKLKMMMEDYSHIMEKEREYNNGEDSSSENDEEEKEEDEKPKSKKEKEKENIYEAETLTPGQRLEFKDRKFDLQNGVEFLQDLMKTEENFDIDKLRILDDEMFKRIFIKK